MVKESHRTDRVAEVIQRELSRLIRLEVKDPRLAKKFVTIDAVKVTRDLANAKIYVGVLGTEAEIKEAIAGLNHAASYLRTVLAQNIQLRVVPQLLFVYDKTLISGNRLASVIDAAMKRSEKTSSEEE